MKFIFLILSIIVTTNNCFSKGTITVAVEKDNIDLLFLGLSSITSIIGIVAIFISTITLIHYIKTTKIASSGVIKNAFTKKIESMPSFLDSQVEVSIYDNKNIKIKSDYQPIKNLFIFEETYTYPLKFGGSYFATRWRDIEKNIDIDLFRKIDKSKMTNSDKFELFENIRNKYGSYLINKGCFKDDIILNYYNIISKSIEKRCKYSDSDLCNRFTKLNNYCEFYFNKISLGYI